LFFALVRFSNFYGFPRLTRRPVPPPCGPFCSTKQFASGSPSHKFLGLNTLSSAQSFRFMGSRPSCLSGSVTVRVYVLGWCFSFFPRWSPKLRLPSRRYHLQHVRFLGPVFPDSKNIPPSKQNVFNICPVLCASADTLSPFFFHPLQPPPFPDLVLPPIPMVQCVAPAPPLSGLKGGCRNPISPLSCFGFFVVALKLSATMGPTGWS